MQYKGYAITIDKRLSMLTITDRHGQETVAYYESDIGIDEILSFAKAYIDGMIETSRAQFTCVKGGLS